jgi:hypothetical protein
MTCYLANESFSIIWIGISLSKTLPGRPALSLWNFLTSHPAVIVYLNALLVLLALLAACGWNDWQWHRLDRLRQQQNPDVMV